MSEREVVLEILKEVKPAVNFEGLNDIIDGGYLESLELMVLISELTERFGFEMDVDWMTPENFNSVDAIADMVIRLRG